MQSTTPEYFMREAIRLSIQNVEKGSGGPFAAVIVKDGVIIASGVNQVTTNNDPTAHAEVMAIRDACTALQSYQLTGCEIYCSAEPCPMCVAAIYWAQLSKVYFAASKEDAAANDFSDEFIYRELELPVKERNLPTTQLLRNEALAAFTKWQSSPLKVKY